MEKFARRCDATGKGINEGFVFGNGEMHFITQEHLIDYLKTLDWEDCDGIRAQDIKDDDDLLEFFYNEDMYYYTDWDFYDIDDEWYDAEGNEYTNQKNEGSAGIISIAELVGRQDNLINRDKEIDMMQKAHDDARNLQIMQDIEKLRPEIESLGLGIKPRYQGILIFVPNTSSCMDRVEIQYEYTKLEKFYNEFYDYNCYKEVLSRPRLTKDIEAKYYGNPKFDTIEDFVKYEKFREELSVLYRRTKQ